MRRGIIGKIKETLSKKPKIPDIIKVQIKNENLHEFNIKILNYEKENNEFKINNKNLKFDLIIKELIKESEIEIKSKKFVITETETLSVDVEAIEAFIKSGEEIKFETIIKNGNISKADVKIHEVSKEKILTGIKDGMDLLCSISKTYYSEIAVAKEKIREIGIKIKRKYPDISFKEYGIKYVFTNIPYKSIEKFNYNDKKGSLEVFYKKNFNKSELINFIVLKNINSNTLKKIFI